MANYTISVKSVETRAEYYRRRMYDPDYNIDKTETQDGSFTISLPTLTGTIIRSVSVTAPVISTQDEGGYGDFTLKLGSTLLGTWSHDTRTTWAASGLSINGNAGSTITVDLKHSPVDHFNSSSGLRFSDTGRVLGQATATIVVEGEFAETPISPSDGERIPKSTINEFSWSPTIIQGTIVSQKLFWKMSSSSSYTEIVLGVDDVSYTFPANFFNVGTINWYVEGIDSAGNVAKSPVQTVDIGIIPSVGISYPLNVNIRNSNIQIFTWEMKETIATGQKSYELQYKGKSESLWHTVTGITSNQYHEFAPNTFSTDEYEWKLKVTNNDDISTDFVTASFVAIGTTNAPNIVNITNSSIPTFTWEITSQDTFEVEINDTNGRIYSSGVQVGTNVRSFTPNIMLNDGNYIVKIRAMNEYGYFTEWAEYSFILSPEKPEAVECIAYANDSHGINIIKSDGEADELFVLRREFGETEWNILAKFDEMYSDNSVITGKKYEYALRNQKKEAGYADSNVVVMTINYQGCLIYDKNEFVELYKTEDEQFNINHKPSKNYTYSYMIGRKYPVKESSEWISYNTSLSCFISFEDYKKLEAFYESNDELWFKSKDLSYKCSIDAIQINETLLGKGYSISIDLSRIDENEVKLIE